MNEKFFDLPREKQDRMINGALEVFARNGYKHASTDDMVRAVGISKGLWFHYFGSKAGIYIFIYGYSVKYLLLEMSTVMDESVTDYFELVRQMAYTRMRVARSYPYMELFLAQASDEDDEEIITETQADRRLLKERQEVVFKNGELPVNAEKPQKERIKRMIRYTVEGLVRDKMLHSQAEPETIYREVKSYLDMIKSMVSSTDFTAKAEHPTMLETVAS